jgi:predicted kinase
MPRRRLVLIEGMVGAGKSTTAERLAATLTADGERVHAFHELADDHPIRTIGAARLQPQGVERGYDPAQWNLLAERCVADGRTLILEGALLQNTVMPLFLDDRPMTVVRAVFADIAARVAPAAPVLIYLRPVDVVAAVTRVHAERGEPWSGRNLAFVSESAWARRRGLSGARAVIELYRAWEPIVDELLATVEPAVVLDPQRDWPGTLRRLCDMVRMPAPA